MCISHESAHFHLQDKLMPPTSVLCTLTNISVAIYSHALMRVHIIGGQTSASFSLSSNWQQIYATANWEATEMLSTYCELWFHENFASQKHTEYCTSIYGYKKTIQLRIKFLGGRFNNNWLTANCIIHALFISTKLVKVPSIALQALARACQQSDLHR